MYNGHRRKQGREDTTLGKYADYAAVWSALDPDDGKGPLGARPLPEVTVDELELGIASLKRSYASNTMRNSKPTSRARSSAPGSSGSSNSPRARCSTRSRARAKAKRTLGLTADGFGALCKTAGDDAAMLAPLILGRFGLRIGEVCGVTLDDLDGNVLTLRRQLDRVGTDGEHGPRDLPCPKGARAPRGSSTLAP